MKISHFKYKLVTAVIILLTANFAVAAYNDNNHNNTNMNNKKSHKWACETNASSASNDADIKADQSMKDYKSGKEAFDFAMKHCRDCTKITCTVQSD